MEGILKTMKLHGIKNSYDELNELSSKKLIQKIYMKDKTLWPGEDEKLLGWLDCLDSIDSIIEDAEKFRLELDKQGITEMILFGMGGSASGANLLNDYLHGGLTVINTIHPNVIEKLLNRDLSQTCFVFNSKSGSTLETKLFLDYIINVLNNQKLELSKHIVIITDPNTQFTKIAKKNNLQCFHSDPDIGGRYSVLSASGVIPVVLSGVDTSPVIRQASRALSFFKNDSPTNEILQLALFFQKESHIVEMSGTLESFNEWLKQLISESTGKDKKGFLPVFNNENNNVLDPYEITIEIRRKVSICGTLGELIIFWELFVAVLGSILQINPFNQPDVELTKNKSKELSNHSKENIEIETHEISIKNLLDNCGYFVFQVYADLNSTEWKNLEKLKNKIRSEYSIPISIDFGPNYLHSTGQFHKGGPLIGSFLQVYDEKIISKELYNEFLYTHYLQAKSDYYILKELGCNISIIQTNQIDKLLKEFCFQER